jgi:hypothetical protein
MSNIVLNYKVCKNIDEPIIEKIVNNSVSEKHKVFVNLYDFSPLKMVEGIIKKKFSGNKNISVFTKDFEDRNEADSIMLENLIQYGDSLAFGMMSESIILNKFAIDKIDFELLKEDINGFLYFDYCVNNVRCYLKSRSSEINNSIICVFWSTEKLIRFINDKDKMNTISNNFAGVHIPKNLCTAYTDNEN